MRIHIGVATGALAGLLAVTGLHAAAEHPSWAYGFAEPLPAPGAAPPPAAAPAAAATPAAPDTTPLRLPGSDRTFTRAEANNRYGPADWFPDEHPAPPDIVAHGREADEIWACGLCHYLGGKGRQENAGLAGLPYEYFLHTMMDFRNGLRHSADPRKANTARMIAFARGMSDDEIEAAARYYSSMPWTRRIRVVETSTVPKTMTRNGVFFTLPGTETEPLGMRIVEGPEDAERFELRDPHSLTAAYAPVGSIKAGATLATTGGNGKTTRCSVCHGPDLGGAGPVPGIAGRSPSYLVRQLYDMQVGTRRGVWTELMKPVVEKLTAEDLVALGAYVASLPPPAAGGR